MSGWSVIKIILFFATFTEAISSLCANFLANNCYFPPAGDWIVVFQLCFCVLAVYRFTTTSGF